MEIAADADLCKVPAGVPPRDHKPNFVDPDDLSVETLTIGALFTVISTIFFVLRLWQNRNKLHWADHLTIIGFVLSVSYTGIIMAMHNYTRHQYDLPLCDYVSNYLWKLLFAQNMLLGSVQFFVKAAILLVYFQLFAINRRMRWIIYGSIIFAGAIYLPHPVVVAALFSPRAGESWGDIATSGRPQQMAFYGPFHGVGSILLDVFILVVPFFILKNLQLPMKKRLGLMVVFAVGFFGVVASVVACYWRFKIAMAGALTGDFQWMQSQLFIWIILEHDAALIAGCMPAVAALIRANFSTSSFFGSLRHTVGRSRRTATMPKSTGSGSSKMSSESQVEMRGRGSSGSLSSGEGRELDSYVAAPARPAVARTTTMTATAQQQHQPVVEVPAGILRTIDVSQEYHPASPPPPEQRGIAL